MTIGPEYFEPIRRRASERWDQLERDPDLAGPWHQLFRQVQSPRHILSELLQNADDAGATEAAIRIDGEAFIFEHNGEDFTEEHFASLCRFGYSNKRALHTIGFRGIGFKSTFSLGDRVELFTPTLGVAFDRKRFTEPKWVSSSQANDKATVVRVAIKDGHRKKELEKNLKEWLKSPVSLLFFKNIRRMTIGDHEVHWGDLGPGPVLNTEWLASFDNQEKSYLLARSDPQNFPEDALAEIRQERMLIDAEETECPACAIEIVLGIEGRLFVVLPTGVKTDLPFACNAPFIQDPARLKIKDPEISPTNRWLLQRAGELAASTMLRWLNSEQASDADRAGAYGWLPSMPYDETELDGVCGELVKKAFLETIKDANFLLTEEGALVAPDECVLISKDLYEVWPGRQAIAVFDERNRPALCHEVSSGDQEKLVEHGFLDKISTFQILSALRQKHLPKPESWRQLLSLWCFVDPLINSYPSFEGKDDLRIIPVQGRDVLCAGKEVVRLGKKKLLQSKEDWQFLGERMSVVNQNWLRFLAEERRKSEQGSENKRTVSAYAVLDAIGLGEPSDAAKVVGQVASEFFSEGEVTLSDAVKIAQIAAKLGATINDSFQYTSQDRRPRSIKETIVFDEDGAVELMVPEEWAEEHLLHPDYKKEFKSCSREEWLRWVSSGRSGMHSFVPIIQKSPSRFSRERMQEELSRRGYFEKFEPSYQDPYFQISDWTFDPEIMGYWEERASEDNTFWGRVLEKVLIQPNSLWADKLSSSASEYASNGNSRPVIQSGLKPEWIVNFSDKPCLKDTHGLYRKPTELLRRTPKTEAVMDVEPFVHPLLDNENTRLLLSVLGVGDMPTGPDRLLDWIRRLASVPNAPAHEVEQWYRRLDQMVDACSTEDLLDIKDTFSLEALILTDGGTWETVQGVYLSSNEEDVPGAEVIRPSVQDLTFWRKIGVSERPTADQAIAWLQSLPSGETIAAENVRRVRALFGRHSVRVWTECGHWLNFAGEWCPTDALSYSVSMQSLVSTRHLHEWVKGRTANFQDLSAHALSEYPFADLPPLSAQIEERFHRTPVSTGGVEIKDWLLRLSRELARVGGDDDQLVEQIKSAGLRMADTKWQTTQGLETIAYIDGTPAGEPRKAEAVWIDDILYVEDKSMAKLALTVSQELGRPFNRTDIVDAIKMCIDRSPEFIREYMEENFELGPYAQTEPSERSELDMTEGNATRTADAEGSKGEHNNSETSQGEPRLSEQEGLTSDYEVQQEDETQEDDGPPFDEFEGTGDEEIVDEEGEDKIRKERRKSQPSLMARFAASLGYRADGENRFYHSDGSWIAKSDGSNFSWARYAASGDVLQYFKPRDHCLKKAPLEIEADVWEIIKSRPETYSLVLSDLDGKPIPVRGQDLLLMRERKEITLYPATYRLVYGNE